MNFFNLKKWYFDLITSQGDSLYLYFITLRVAGFKQGMASAHLSLADRRHIRSSAKTNFAAPEANGNLNLGRHACTSHKNFVDVRMEFDNLALHLRYTTLVGLWQPTAGGILWQEKQRYLGWKVPQPEARVEGTMAFHSQKMKVTGLGYQDIVEITIPPWKLPTTELLWGRAHCEGYAVVFNQMKTRRGEVLQYITLKREAGIHPARLVDPERDETENVFLLTRDDQDKETSIVHKAFSLTLKRSSVLEESPIASRERFKSGISRHVLGRICGKPEEKKIVSDAILQLDGKIYRGHALHERAVWHWKKKEQP